MQVLASVDRANWWHIFNFTLTIPAEDRANVPGKVRNLWNHVQWHALASRCRQCCLVIGKGAGTMLTRMGACALAAYRPAARQGVVSMVHNVAPV